MDTINYWEYGIAVGVLILIVPALIWVVKYLLKSNTETVKENHKELKGLILRLHTEDSQDAKELTIEVAKLNNNLSSLTGMITFIFNKYINGGTDAS